MSGDRKIETFYLSTFGCQMNVADSATLVAALTTRGYRRVTDEEDADLLVLNTCSVREKAEDRVYGRLGDLHRIKKNKPHAKIAVVGCMAQRMADELIDRLPFVDYVLGTDRLFELPDVIEGIEGTRPVMTAFGHEDLDSIAPIKDTDYTGFVTISRGCDNYCTYCIVPYVRGPERSHSANHVVDAVSQMVDQGVVEVTLLGQNVNSYQDHSADFPRLLQRVVAESGIERLRFMTSHPKDLSRKLVDVMVDEPRLMPNIHLPLQSGANRILKKMGRRYTIEHYRDIIEYIRSQFKYVSITTDLMVGFSGETEEDYELTLKAVREIEFDNAFMFRYSSRPGTTATKYEDDITESDKIRRLRKLINLQQDISKKRNQREVGQVRYCLVEGKSRRSDDFFRGRTEGNKVVIFEAEPEAAGTIVPVRIMAADAFTLHGEIAEIN